MHKENLNIVIEEAEALANDAKEYASKMLEDRGQDLIHNIKLQVTAELM